MNWAQRVGRLGRLLLVALVAYGAGLQVQAVAPNVSYPARPSRSLPELLGAIEKDMVEIPGGKFTMGDPIAKEPSIAKPVHVVRVNAFKLSRFEVTFAQYDAYATSEGKKFPDDEGWCRDARPVINVSWYDAQGFIVWLNQQTGRRYRLPSEAEWEYAARAESATNYPWGMSFDPALANGKGMSGADVWPYTAPVGSFPPNKWGLYDMIGNVMEWTADCWHANYEAAPKEGSAWLEGNCSKRVFRGGAWASDPRYLEVSFRMFVDASFRNHALGFRLAEDR